MTTKGVSANTSIRWWQVWRYSELKRENEASLVALVRERPDFTEADARFFAALCRSGRRTPEWLVEKMSDTKSDHQERGKTMTFVCPTCSAPVSVEGKARDGELLHECSKHGWVSPVAKEERKP